MVGFDGCWHYNDAGSGKVWDLVIRNSGYDHTPKLPKGKWWVVAVSINRGELLNCSTNCEHMKVITCDPSQQVNKLIKLEE